MLVVVDGAEPCDTSTIGVVVEPVIVVLAKVTTGVVTFPSAFFTSKVAIVFSNQSLPSPLSAALPFLLTSRLKLDLLPMRL